MVINPINWILSYGEVGSTGEKVIIIDNFFSDPDLVTKKIKSAEFHKDNSYYPGIRAPVSSALHQDILVNLQELVLKEFSCTYKNTSIKFSKITIENKNWNLLQTLPHVDSTNYHDVAFVIYLFKENYGGTTFYRHKTTGFYNLDKRKLLLYHKSVSTEFREIYNSNLSNVIESNTTFEKIYSATCRFNRCILYRGSLLHSADVVSHTNRDTITGFLLE